MRIPAVFLALALLAPDTFAEDDPLAEARQAFWQRDHDRAEDLLAFRLVACPHDVEARKLLATVYLRVERPDDARAVLEPALRVAPEDPEVLAGLWEAELAAGGWTDEARKALRAKLEALEASVPAGEVKKWRRYALFHGYGLLSDREGKARIRDMILARWPDEPPEFLEGDLMEAVIVTKELEPRIALIRRFLAVFPDSKQSNYMREIWLYMVREDPARLRADATAMLEKDPGNRRVRAALGRWLLAAKKPDPAGAAEQMKRALELLDTPKDIDRPAMMTDAQWEKMLEETRGKYLAYLGRAQQMMGENAEAVKTLTRAAEILSHHVDLYLALGEAHFALKNIAEAKAAWERSCESGPSPKAEERLRMQGMLSSGSEGLEARHHFVDVTEKAGLAKAGGSRIAVGDVNGDGWPDLLFGGHRLFLNDGDGTFTSAPMPKIPGSRGGLLADLDNDGDLDLYVFRTGHPMVLANDGKGVFTDRTPKAMKLTGRFFTEAGAVFDFDGDGLLDLYQANYEQPPTPPWARARADILWKNKGGFDFEDASKRLTGISAEPMCGRGCAPADFDDDGDVDLFVANYRLDPDKLFVSDGKGGLGNRARFLGVEGDCEEGYFGHGIGPAWGDLNGDGTLDLVVPNLAHPRYIGFSDVTRIYLNPGNPVIYGVEDSDGVTRMDFGKLRFRDVLDESGIRFEETHSNASLADVDLDGDLDLFLTSVYKGRWSFLYLNDGKARFTDATWRTNTRIDNGWGSVFADLDMDGDPDLVVKTSQGMKLLENVCPAGGHLGLTLFGRDGNGSAIGARVVLTAADGRKQVREVFGGSGTGCQDDPSLRFGVSGWTGPFRIEVRWPGGRTQRIEGVKGDAIYRLIEGGNLEKVN